MTDPINTEVSWVDGNLRLSGIDNKMIALLQAIAATGSISQAARTCNLSYKGAWQIIERANNCAPKALISTITGGSKGGGANLTKTGRGLLDLYTGLQQQHRDFLQQLNQTLKTNPESALLLQRLAVKTSVRNQLFGSIMAIEPGAVNANVTVALAGNIRIIVSLSLSALQGLELEHGMDAVLLINGTEILFANENDTTQYSASNRLSGVIIDVQEDVVNSEITVLLTNGETLAGLMSKYSANAMALKNGANVWVVFNANAPILGMKM